jgi:hypothetical protein
MSHESRRRRASETIVFRLGPGKCLLLVASSLLLAYGIALVTFMVRWIRFWMRGEYLVPYLFVFVTTLTLLLFWWARRRHHGPLPILSTIMYSVVAGYVAGLIAMVLYPIFQSDGLQYMVEALRFPTIEAEIAFFWFPIRLLTWLFGGITGMTMLVLSRRWRRMKC